MKTKDEIMNMKTKDENNEIALFIVVELFDVSTCAQYQHTPATCTHIKIKCQHFSLPEHQCGNL